ncbi:sugar-binding transcriptional regulator [Microbacterium sp. cx-59]|uniref:sugar-binding transcriptional regulator n=1 Tax=Microbacterium sp. cx-59 TaxID=2891207 RepID=UPI001E398965|nr:sugar-binding domain-containing protein [Microbacterium sp. cx-59]MCC4907904.1 MarR family transcriptional regulator [Microbacterium sp. cx-59]
MSDELRRHDERALAAATAHYLHGETMESIGARLGMSRSTVSRLLKHARETGLVEIRVRSPRDAPEGLADTLRLRYGVTTHTALVREDASEVERLDIVAATAADVLATHIGSHMTVGLAWGSTIAAVSRRLVPKPTTGTRFVQLNGSGDTRTTGLGYASELLRRFGRAFTAQVQQFPVPAFFDDPATKTALWRERSMHRILDAQASMDAVVFSVGASGSSVPSHVYAGGYLEPADLAELDRERVVGDVATVFYRADGSSADIALNARASGPALADLARVPRRICIVSGDGKLDSVRGALAAGLVTDLVIDEPSARALAG